MCACDYPCLRCGSAHCMGSYAVVAACDLVAVVCDRVHKNECYLCFECESQGQVLRANGHWVDGRQRWLSA